MTNTPDRPTRGLRRDYVRALDGLRGFALLLVVFSHASQYEMDLLGAGLPLEGAGRFGVFIFFVLSAYLLTKQFLDTELTRENLVPRLSEYFFRRFARIYPLYLFALFVYWSPALITGEGLYVNDLAMLSESAFLYRGYSFFWTIPVEFTYYFVLPAVAIFMITLARHRALRYGILAAVILATAASFPRTYEEGFMPFVFIFLMGSVVAGLQKDWGARFQNDSRLGRGLRISCDILALIALGVLLLHVPGLYNAVFGTDYHPQHFSGAFFAIGLASSLLVFCLLNGSGLITRLFAGRSLGFVGQISFSAYVWHMLVLRGWSAVTPFANGHLNLGIFLVLTGLLSYGSYHLFERRIYKSPILRQPWDVLVRRWA